MANETYQGQKVQSKRDAKKGDPGFQEGTDQVCITLEDGTEKVVKRSEVKSS